MADDTGNSRRKPVAFVTGGTSGIGLVVCHQLAAKGYTVIFTSRSSDKGKATVTAIKDKLGGGVEVSFILMELGDLTSVKRACDELVETKQPLDFVLLNAGLSHFSSKEPSFSAQDIEDTIATNHVAGTYIAMRLCKLMEETSIVEDPTVTFVSSDLHNLHSSTGAHHKVGPPVKDEVVTFLSQQGTEGVALAKIPHSLPEDDPHYVKYDGAWAYKYSKLLNLVSMLALHERSREQKTRVLYNAMEPGFVPASELSRDVRHLLGGFGTSCLKWVIYNTPMKWFISYVLGQPVRTLDEAAASEVYALTSGKSGIYYRLDEEDSYAPVLKDASVLNGLWKGTTDLLKEKGFDIE
mmetsp:Transcript_30959/g.45907  ORF Transcript_30959/g.45907 Transcript_30959/m.45907 type:complete len:352 (-) Transcript_30959:191-1246(-)|eukprot:CAMPEP_0194057722 /NCGR_PEP_ID=MMETSP0009_2-20130614/64062_1 /TAXON_ID=210454 /ORGANISM="Grammatophora oceanica, Strain CCMP 410" /LENGTH=351 /DNA_ID=CAMNT_0038707583 /DNA_START=33 /DNA_END=1091 /DNA_ORIENTATION=-